jgi:DNA topoisomerase-1
MRLRYTSDTKLGFTRVKKFGMTVYVNQRGHIILNPVVRSRIKRLGIPPAYTDVWICPYANGHLQATGRDARGRKQYLYHAEWITQRDEVKFHRMLVFAKALSAIRRRVDRDLTLRGMPKEKVLAALVRLLDTSYARIGNEEYAKENHSFGLTTLQNRHVHERGGQMTLAFRGKEGIAHEIEIDDLRLKKIVAACQDMPGHELFEYFDHDHEVRSVSSDDVNEYLRSIAHEEITAKDFRTWHGTLIAATSLWNGSETESKKEIRSNMKVAIAAAADALGNTPTICKKSYIHPQIFAAYQAGGFYMPTVKSVVKSAYPRLRAHELALVVWLKSL